MRVSAFFACNLISAEGDPTKEAELPRVHRMQVALSEALHRIMESQMQTPEKGHA